MAHIQCLGEASRFGAFRASNRVRRVMALLLSIAAILIFLFMIGPAFTRLPGFRPIVDFIDERGIEANAYYYTEVEEFSEADINMNNTMDYGPKDNRPYHK